MARNIIQKIREAHLAVVKPGFPDVLAIDLHLLHEVTSPQAFAELKQRGLAVHAPAAALPQLTMWFLLTPMPGNLRREWPP